MGGKKTGGKRMSNAVCIRLPQDIYRYVLAMSNRRNVSVSMVLRDIALEHMIHNAEANRAAIRATPGTIAGAASGTV